MAPLRIADGGRLGTHEPAEVWCQKLIEPVKTRPDACKLRAILLSQSYCRGMVKHDHRKEQR